MASRLPEGTIIYAKGEADAVRHTIAAVGKTVEIAILDLSLAPDDLLSQVSDLAQRLLGKVSLQKTLAA